MERPPDRRRLITHFTAADNGPWQVVRLEAIAGRGIAPIDRLAIVETFLSPGRGQAEWPLRGVPGHGRYVTRAERAALEARQPALGRPDATCAALIPVSKSAAWWDLAQDERRAILEERSAHIITGLGYLPAIARRLYHGRDLGEPFDFLTWFEYAPGEAARFDELVSRLRDTEEWRYVEREVDIRLRRRT
ncbi:MAG: chlorite dismutase family protein [Vicinamibacterales bacterium]